MPSSSFQPPPEAASASRVGSTSAPMSEAARDGGAHHLHSDADATPRSAAVAGIGGTVLSPPPPPAINNYFQSTTTSGGMNGGGINVDNIFASMTEGTDDGGGSSSYGYGNNSSAGGIFTNFAAMSGGGAIPQQAFIPPTIPFRKYSDNTNNFSRTNVIDANSDAVKPSAMPGNGTGAEGLARSGSEGLSKSVGSPSFLRPSGRNVSDSETDPASSIRHAGYLLKRSNLPFTMPANVVSTPVAVAADGGASVENNAIIGGIAPLPDLTAMDDPVYDGLFTLPFGGSDDRVVGGESNALEAIGAQPAIEQTATVSITIDGTVDEPVTSTTDECFCSPIARYFGSLFGIQRPSNALNTTKNDAIEGKDRTSPSKRHRSSLKLPSSPEPTRPLPITPQMSPSYSVPLKAPARSEPMPISPPAVDKTRLGHTGILSQGNNSGSGGPRSRSYSNGGKGGTSNNIAAAQPKKKKYPPPPPNYIDPKDGHIWRAKYCVLEEGILYFYRTAEEGESDEAQMERYESRLYDERGEDIVLGEEVEFRTSSPKTTFAAKPGAGSGRRMSANERTSSKDLFDLSKSPMPMKRSYMFDFNKSPLERSQSSVLTGASGDDEDAKARPSFHHSGSMGTFNQDADILWEKRVALDCVGAVRSSEQDHGNHAFELLAFGSDERGEDHSDFSTRGSRSSGVGGQKQEIIDRLVLRAGGTDEMNAWMFQFYRSLASVVKQHFVDSVRSAGDASSKFADISPPGAHHRRLPTPIHGACGKGGSILSPLLSKQSFASSPTTAGGGNHSFHESFSPNIVGSLSHGHGRNALYRRQVRDNKSTGISASSAISPLPTPTGTPLGGSPVDALLKKKPLLPTIPMVQGDSSKIQNKAGLQSLRDLRDGKGKEESDATAAPAPKKYIPPHIRRKLAAAASSSGDGGNDKETKKATTEKRIPLNDAAGEKGVGIKRSSSDVLDETLSDSVFSAGSTSSLLSQQLEDDEEDFSISVNVRLGGCADPTVVVGSIVDHHYIERKASVVGNARLEAYAGKGGGFYASHDRHPRRRTDEELTLDDLDTDGSAHATSRRSVLKWEVGASSECGIRNSNEDSFVCINNLDHLIESQGLVSFSQQDFGQTSQQGLYAIFDGHVGNQAARFSAEKFPGILMEEQSALASRDSACLSSIEERADTVLKAAFNRLDKEFCTLCTQDGRDWDCGSTALVALIVDDVVSLANLGDCSGVVCRLVSSEYASDVEPDDRWDTLEQVDHHEEVWDRASGGGATTTSGGTLLWKEVTETHSPIVDEERARIEQANGWIIKETEIPIGQLHRMDIFDKDVVEIVKRCFADRMKQHRSDPVRQIQIARTCGDLAVSRAIGDRDFKAAYNMPSNAGAGAAEPHLGKSWEGPLVFIYPEGHSGRFKGDIVSSVPDIKSFKVGQEGVVDEFLLMACDGLWDVMDGDDAVRIAKELLFDKKLSAKDGAARLAELAQHLGSSDNITVILIRFYWEESAEE